MHERAGAGLGGNGELGNGNDGNSNVPVQVLGNHTFTSISAGWNHICGVDSEGRGWCWGECGACCDHSMCVRLVLSVECVHARSDAGAGGFGGLGNGHYEDFNVPVQASGNHTFMTISAGAYYTCGVAVRSRPSGTFSLLPTSLH